MNTNTYRDNYNKPCISPSTRDREIEELKRQFNMDSNPKYDACNPCKSIKSSTNFEPYNVNIRNTDKLPKPFYSDLGKKSTNYREYPLQSALSSCTKRICDEPLKYMEKDSECEGICTSRRITGCGDPIALDLDEEKLKSSKLMDELDSEISRLRNTHNANFASNCIAQKPASNLRLPLCVEEYMQKLQLQSPNCLADNAMIPPMNASEMKCGDEDDMDSILRDLEREIERQKADMEALRCAGPEQDFSKSDDPQEALMRFLQNQIAAVDERLRDV